jgi:phenylalanyl-tRNA synthetase beta chain
LRQSLLPGMLGALAFNSDRRQGEVRLFEVGHVFPPPEPDRVARALARSGSTVIAERDVLGLALAGVGDDARSAAAAWQVLVDAFGIIDVELVVPGARSRDEPESVPAGLHPTRWARLVVSGREGGPGQVVGVVGEVDPTVLAEFGLDAEHRRVGWLEVDLEALLEDAPRRGDLVTPVSRFPSSDIDLAFVVDEAVPAASVEKTLRQEGGGLLESVALFDVYRGPGAPEGTRSLAYRLRLCAPDRTLTDQEVAEVRARCIAAVEQAHRARLRG